MRLNNLLPAFLITLIQLSVCYLTFGCWLEEWEALFQNFFAGIYSLPPKEMVYIDIYGGIIPLLCKLAYAAHPYPINEYLLFAFIAVCCFIINYCVLSFLKNTPASKTSFIITIIIFNLLLFPQFTVILNCTRMSVLIGMAAFFASAVFFIHGRKDAWQLALVVLLLTASTIMRSFTAFFTTGLVLVLSFIIWRFHFITSRFGWIFIVFFFIQAGLIAGLLYYQSNNSNPGERYVQNYEYAVTDRNDLLPLAPGADRKDSIRYQLMQHWLVTDTATVSESFLRGYIRHITMADILSDREYMSKRGVATIDELVDFMRQYIYAVIAIFGFILILPLRQKFQGILWIMIVTGLITVLSIMSYTSHKWFAPLVCLLIAGLWLLWIQQFISVEAWKPERIRKVEKPQYLLLLCVMLASVWCFKFFGETRKEYVHWHDAYTQFIHTVQADSLHPLIMLSADMSMFSNKAFEKFPSRFNGEIVMLNAGYLTFYEFIRQPYRERYKLDIINGNSLARFIRDQNQKGVVLLTDLEKFSIFQNYLKEFFQLSVSVDKLDIPPIQSTEKNIMYFFRITPKDK